MRIAYRSLVAVAAVLLVPGLLGAQEASRAVAGGGIKAPGWSGQVDPGSIKAGQGVNNALLAAENGGLHVTTGPAITYWETGKSASGNYTVSATFTEPKFMNLNTHPHPYGIVIAGNDMGTPNNTYLYCAAYGNGKFIVRGMGPAAFQLNGREGEANDAVHKAAGVGQPVTQEVAMSVKGDSVTCSINGTVVGTYSKADLVKEGRLKSLDGAYGIRFAHNTDAVVTDFKVTKQ
jgi:hypothetical protein